MYEGLCLNFVLTNTHSLVCWTAQAYFWFEVGATFPSNVVQNDRI